MRKTFLVIFLVLLGSTNLFSQTFTFVTIDPNPVYGDTGDQIKSHAVVHNLTNNTIPITISVINRSVTAGWDSIGFCTWVNCYAAGYYSHTENLHTNTYDTFYVYFYPYNIPGSGSCTVTMTNQSTTISHDFAVVANPIGIKKISTIVKDFALSQNYPNPFNPATKINFSIPKSDYVDLRVYDLLGREVEVLTSQYLIAGEYEVEFDARNLSSGMYYYRLRTGDNIAVKKMTLVK
ncbi:MAG: T9SS C-terminal target domain-containing protein [Ignavibacteriae bacterium]|nr:MAG: T9SS C-terminal target domain-containing protein [Ignavibacteriota bacterium]